MSLTKNETKTCPYCAETIKFDAVICRYCKKDLPKKGGSIEKISNQTYSANILPTTNSYPTGNQNQCRRGTEADGYSFPVRKKNSLGCMSIIIIAISLASIMEGIDFLMEGEPEPQVESAETTRLNSLKSKYEYNVSPYHLKAIYGDYETLPGTNNSQWVIYFPKGDFTAVSRKSSDLVFKIRLGRSPE